MPFPLKYSNLRSAHSTSASQECQTSRASKKHILFSEKSSRSSHLHFRSASGHSGDVAHDILGCHRLPCSALSTETWRKTKGGVVSWIPCHSSSKPPNRVTDCIWHLLRHQLQWFTWAGWMFLTCQPSGIDNLWRKCCRFLLTSEMNAYVAATCVRAGPTMSLDWDIFSALFTVHCRLVGFQIL